MVVGWKEREVGLGWGEGNWAGEMDWAQGQEVSLLLLLNKRQKKERQQKKMQMVFKNHNKI